MAATNVSALAAGPWLNVSAEEVVNLLDEPEYLSDDGLTALAICVSVIASVCALALTLLLYAVVRARRDKPVQAMGYAFVAILVFGSCLGEVFLILVGIQMASPNSTTWALCHVETGLLLLHLNMLHAPLTSKLWRVSFKIRRAETRLLKIWDGTA